MGREKKKRLQEAEQTSAAASFPSRGNTGGDESDQVAVGAEEVQQQADPGQDIDLGSPPVFQVPPSVIAEIEQLHAKVCQLQAQDDDIQTWSKL